jgi:hypothetical protein
MLHLRNCRPTLLIPTTEHVLPLLIVDLPSPCLQGIRTIFLIRFPCRIGQLHRKVEECMGLQRKRAAVGSNTTSIPASNSTLKTKTIRNRTTLGIRHNEDFPALFCTPVCLFNKSQQLPTISPLDIPSSTSPTTYHLCISRLAHFSSRSLLINVHCIV